MKTKLDSVVKNPHPTNRDDLYYLVMGNGDKIELSKFPYVHDDMTVTQFEMAIRKYSDYCDSMYYKNGPDKVLSLKDFEGWEILFHK